MAVVAAAAWIDSRTSMDGVGVGGPYGSAAIFTYGQTVWVGGDATRGAPIEFVHHPLRIDNELDSCRLYGFGWIHIAGTNFVGVPAWTMILAGLGGGTWAARRAVRKPARDVQGFAIVPTSVNDPAEE